MGAARDLIFTILGIDKGSEALDKVGKSADKAADRLDNFGNVGTKVMLGTVAAAASAGVGIGAALAGTAAVVGASGLAIAASNQQVKDSFGDMWYGVEQNAKTAAQPLTQDLLGISTQVGATFDAITPKLQGLFTGSMPAVHALVDGVTGFITETMPGLEVAVDHAAVPAQGLRDLMIDTGKGVSEFFTNISAGSESSGKILQDFGHIIRDALGFAGTELAKLSNDGSPAVHHLGETFHQLLGVVDQLATGALPILFGAMGTGMTVISGLLSIVGGLAGVLGPLAGIAVSTAAGLKLVDAITFGKVTTELGNLKAAIGGAEGLGGKLKAGLGSLLTGFGPVGLAAGALGIVLHELGSKQEEAAKRAAEHKSDIEGLTKALVENKGVVSDQIAQDRVRQAVQAGVYQKADEVGLAHYRVTQALLGNRDAYNEVAAAFDKSELLGKGSTTKKLADAMGVSMANVGDVTSAADKAFHDLADAMFAAQDEAAGVAKEQGAAADATKTHTAALLHLNDVLLGFVDKNLGYRTALQSEKEAHERATEAIKKHGASSQEATDATLTWEQSILASVSAASALAESQYKGSDAVEAGRLKMEAQNKEILRLAEVAGNTAPPALRQMLAGMDGAAMAALGMSVTVDKAGNSVIRLPDGKTITLTAQDKATPAIVGVENALNNLHDKTVRLTVLTFGNIQSTGGGKQFAGFAEGGRYPPGKPFIAGEDGKPELIFPDSGGFVMNGADTARLLSGADRAGSAVLGGPTTVRVVLDVTGADADLKRLFRRAVKLEAGGSAEKFFRS